ncbi:MAG TPA: MFS transporter [Rugosimonospora sp.]|nr:MFS transporter [Rugosimonospora sp.]
MSGNGGRLDGRYWKFWTAATGSALGSGMVTVAAPLLVASRSADPLVVSGASAAAALPWLLFTLPAGAVVDRLDRRHVMIVMDLLRVLLIGALGALIMVDRAGLPLVYTVLFLMGTAETVFRSASQALVPDLVRRDSLEHANSWLIGSTMLTAGIIAAPLGALLFHLHGSVPFLANAATYALSAALLLAIAGSYRGTPATTEARAKGAFLAEIGEGVRWLAGQRLVRTLALLIGLLNITLTAALSILVLVVRERLHAPDWWYGVLVTCMAAGGLLGSAIGPWLVRKVTATWTLRVGLIIEAGLHLVLATSHSTITVAAAFAVFGVHGSLWTIVSMSIRQRLTPPAMQGRVGSVYLFTAAGGNSLGAVLGGALAGWFGLPAPYWVGFVAAVLVVAVTWRVFSPSVIATAYGSGPDAVVPAQATGTEPVPGGAAVGQGSNL